MQQSEYRARIEQLRAHLRNQGYGSVVCHNYPRIARRFLEYHYDHAKTAETALPADIEDFLRRERRVYRNQAGHPEYPEMAPGAHRSLATVRRNRLAGNGIRTCWPGSTHCSDW